jgi:hypothetical protein
MAKELPYFKFEPNQWENGNIQMCSFEAQGVFIAVCSMYWQRLGDLPYKLALGKICNGNATALNSLSEHEVIKVIDGNICIDFLNEQLSEFTSISETNSENARSGWEKRRLKATAMRPHSEGNAIRGDKRREEIIHGDGKKRITIKPVYPKDKIIIIKDLRVYFESTKQLQQLSDKGWIHFDAFMDENPGNVFDDAGHLYNTFRNFSLRYSPPARAPDKFKDAAFDKVNLTLEAWEKLYAFKLKNDNEFRRNFGYHELSLNQPVGIKS